jgi:hypothetical protein
MHITPTHINAIHNTSKLKGPWGNNQKTFWQQAPQPALPWLRLEGERKKSWNPNSMKKMMNSARAPHTQLREAPRYRACGRGAARLPPTEAKGDNTDLIYGDPRFCDASHTQQYVHTEWSHLPRPRLTTPTKGRLPHFHVPQISSTISRARPDLITRPSWQPPPQLQLRSSPFVKLLFLNQMMGMHKQSVPKTVLYLWRVYIYCIWL